MNYALKQRFYIDNGELDEQSKEQAFVLGFEFAQMYEWVWSRGTGRKTIHAANLFRIEMLARRRGYALRSSCLPMSVWVEVWMESMP